MSVSVHSSRRRLFVRAMTAAVAAIALVATAGSVAIARQSEAAGRKPAAPVVFTVDVAEDLSGRFVPTFVKPEHTQPERGSFYVTEGRVFPAGTIEGDGAAFDPRRSGHIGIWISRGTHLAAASDIPAASYWAHTAQLFVLGRQAKEQLATEGLEGAGTRSRVVTGGLGNYAGYIGEQQQTVLGFNTTGGVNLRVTFILQKAQ